MYTSRISISLRQEFKTGHTWIEEILIQPKPIRAHHVIDQIGRRKPLRHRIRAPRDLS